MPPKKGGAKKPTLKRAVRDKAATPPKKRRAGGGAGAPPSSDKRYWLMKSEPEPRFVDVRGKAVDVSYGLDEFEKDGVAEWDGVRNHAAKNFMRDDMKLGDEVFYYHSNCRTPGIVGIARVCKEGYPDPSAFDKDDAHYDPKSDADNPRWFRVDIEFVRRTRRLIGLKELKANPALADMALVRQGRLSVQPVKAEEWEAVLAMEGEEE